MATNGVESAVHDGSSETASGDELTSSTEMLDRQDTQQQSEGGSTGEPAPVVADPLSAMQAALASFDGLRVDAAIQVEYLPYTGRTSCERSVWTKSRTIVFLWFCNRDQTKVYVHVYGQRSYYNYTLASTPPGMPGTHPPIFLLGDRQREYPPNIITYFRI